MAINGEGRNCKLSHNEIFDTTYSAIGFSGRDLVIENNLISDCMKVLHDGAAIYCFGAKHSILRNNFAHDIVDTGGYGASPLTTLTNKAKTRPWRRTWQLMWPGPRTITWPQTTPSGAMCLCRSTTCM